MEVDKIIEFISRGRTDYIFDLLKQPNWKGILLEGQVKPLQWLVYYNDTTALKAVLKEGGSLDSINLNDELGNAALYLLDNGADKTAKDANGDSPLSWASEHLRPGTILSLLTYDGFQISDKHKTINKSDHGHGWGNSMDWNLLGDYLPE